MAGKITGAPEPMQVWRARSGREGTEDFHHRGTEDTKLGEGIWIPFKLVLVVVRVLEAISA
jgi:hypothetical protein